ncbi:hypothetical protein L323_18590 [Ruminiclostridium papyrosolvens C7]|uniref:Uncharacterized protein n=2 Tax=Ruminiclostridium papyrosolvens TaxID=29362 RepID=U4QWX8_9FIRM|nr:hypothetical protein L323_18590 [Ruminiclostridium papyrosolvens C7]
MFMEVKAIEDKMFKLADRLRELKEAKKQAERQVKDINTEIDNTDYALSELMAESETQNFTRSGTMFFLTTTTRASALSEKKTELYEVLKEKGFGDLVYETVNANSLSAFVKEQTSENEDLLPDWLEGLVKVFEKTSVGVRKTAK